MLRTPSQFHEVCETFVGTATHMSPERVKGDDRRCHLVDLFVDKHACLSR